MKKQNRSKGFTFAELLIVVAIVGVLTALAVSIYDSQMLKSQKAVDAANMRMAKSMVLADTLENAGAYDSGVYHYAFDYNDETSVLTITDLAHDPAWEEDRLAAPIWKPGTLRGKSDEKKDKSIDITVENGVITSANWRPIDPDVPYIP